MRKMKVQYTKHYIYIYPLLIVKRNYHHQLYQNNFYPDTFNWKLDYVP
jgi:hypothetical protein